MTDTDHLPECLHDDTIYGLQGLCICDELRACEQRSYALGIEVGKHDGWVAGHAAGVQAAREAVERASSLLQPLGPALAAIDALLDTP